MRQDNYTEEERHFIKRAEAYISENPEGRLSDITRKTLHAGNFLIDGHTHTYDGSCISVHFFVIRMIGAIDNDLIKRAWRLFTNIPWQEKYKSLSKSEIISEVLNHDDALINLSMSDYFKYLMEETSIELKLIDSIRVLNEENEKWMYFLRRTRFIVSVLAKKNMQNVFSSFQEYFAINNQVDERELVSVVIGANPSLVDDYQAEKPSEEQSNELLELSRRYPIIPFLPIDLKKIHNKTDKSNQLFDEFLEAFNSFEETCYYGIEINPALGYLPSDPLLKVIFEVCSRKNIPIISNCGDDFLYFNKSNTRTNALLMGFNEPKEWIPVLESFENLHLNLAHFGGLEAWSNEQSITNHRIEHIIDMMHKYKVYSDFSYTSGDKKAIEKFNRLINGYSDDALLLENRCFYGSDFWLSLPVADLRTCQMDFLKVVEEVRDKMLYINALRFLGLEDYIQENKRLAKGTTQTSAPF